MRLHIISASHGILYAATYNFGAEVIGLVKNKFLIVPTGTVDEYYPQKSVC